MLVGVALLAASDRSAVRVIVDRVQTIAGDAL